MRSPRDRTPLFAQATLPRFEYFAAEWRRQHQSGDEGTAEGRVNLMYGALALIESGAVLSSLYLSRSLSIFRPTTTPDSLPKLRSSRISRVHSGRILQSMALLETPDWFKAERVRCLTDASVPRDQGEATYRLEISVTYLWGAVRELIAFSNVVPPGRCRYLPLWVDFRKSQKISHPPGRFSKLESFPKMVSFMHPLRRGVCWSMS